jgi:hypothetical protein
MSFFISKANLPVPAFTVADLRVPSGKITILSPNSSRFSTSFKARLSILPRLTGIAFTFQKIFAINGLRKSSIFARKFTLKGIIDPMKGGSKAEA